MTLHIDKLFSFSFFKFRYVLHQNGLLFKQTSILHFIYTYAKIVGSNPTRGMNVCLV
jgi:hypothetical protein